MERKLVMLFIIFILTATPAVASLGNYRASSWTDENTRTEQVIGKLGFGAKNALMGWSELLYHPYAAGNKGENIIEGAVVGAWYGLADTFGGLIQFLTFPFLFDIKLPEGGTHMFSAPIP